jgi:transketolase
MLNQEPEKEACLLLHTEMGNGRLHDVQSCLAWKAPNDAQLENALAQNPATLGDY